MCGALQLFLILLCSGSLSSVCLSGLVSLLLDCQVKLGYFWASSIVARRHLLFALVLLILQRFKWIKGCLSITCKAVCLWIEGVIYIFFRLHPYAY